MKIQDRVSSLIASVSNGMHEREEIIAVALLGALCGQNTFLYGPPGTAKSLISRRIAYAFDEPTYFEYLMNRFSTPEEVFGPVSIKALKEDQYTRKTDRYLPKAEFAFLDEIWKSSPAILNTLLTLINERIFRNGDVIEKAPLKALIAASNETPAVNQGLDALYDRFIIRIMVGPIQERDNFDRLLDSKPSSPDIEVPGEIRVARAEWELWGEEIHKVGLSREVLTIIHLIKKQLAAEYTQPGVYVSDRRWQRSALLMKASAYFNGRDTTNHSDALLLAHCLWSDDKNREAVREIVYKAVEACGLESGLDVSGMDQEKDLLDKEISNELFFNEDVYEKVFIEDGVEYARKPDSDAGYNFPINVGKDHGRYFFKSHFEINDSYRSKKQHILYIPVDKFGSLDKFNPYDIDGNELKDFSCYFDDQGSCKIECRSVYGGSVSSVFITKILHKQGSKKSVVNERLVDALLKSVALIKGRFTEALDEVEARYAAVKVELASPFVKQDAIDIVLSGIDSQIEGIKLRIKDCERLESLCR